ncbi:WAT1-related protein At4g30420-like isoform X1 [Vicia villosa]|uniref:WAT1-related protein At4g30420-like isoform X1 n=1 Tax=Vicia villosa TaxID=3911 RepID=UPI00273A8745|nr:WAT1-related protein At4g30420-like isoform X1 [Vicia villosa]
MASFNMEYYLPIIVMVLIQFIYSGMTLGTRIALVDGMSPRVFVVYRCAFATIFLAPIAYFSSRRNSTSYSLNLRSFFLIFLTALIGITINQNLYFEGLYLSSSSISSAMTNLVPAVTLVIGAFTRMEKMNIRSLRTIAKVLGTMICVSGAICISLLKGQKLLNADNLPPKSILESDENWLLGCLFLFGGCVAWSIWLILQVPAYASHPNSLSLSTWMCLMATLQSSLVTLFMEPDLNSWKITSLLQFGCVLYSGIMGSGVTFYLQAWCISRRGPFFSAMFSPLLTLIVTILATLWLHEEIYIGSLIGAIGVIIGLYVVLWGKAEDLVDVKTENYGKIYCKTDLEDPLLHN